MINKKTILSTYNDRLTLLEWLKKVEQGLSEGVLTSCELVKTARASFKFKLSFEDGTTAESNELTIEADNIASASFVNGHLIFVTQDGNRIDAGHLSGNLGNVICEVLDVHGDIHTDGTIYAGGNVNVNGNVNSSNIGAMAEDVEDLQENVDVLKDKLENVEKTQYGLSINEYTTINSTLRTPAGIETSSINASGKAYLFENIVDANGNLRFVEDEGTIDVDFITQPYARWSLSGTHLMIVLGGTIQNGVTIPNDTELFHVTLPTHIADKIVALAPPVITYGVTLTLYGSGGLTQTLPNCYWKKTNNVISLHSWFSSLTLDSRKTFRIQFDLLIDND